MPQKKKAARRRKLGDLAVGKRKLPAGEQKRVKGGQLTASSQKLADSQALADKLRSRASSPGEW